MSDLHQQVQATIDELVESGTERGMQVAVYRHGEQIVDAVAGVADAETGRPVTPDTPFYNFSIGKGATATIAHVLAERGELSYDTKIAEVWPEFGAHGKGAATIRQALSHTVGVPGVPQGTTVEDLCDWQTMVAGIADEPPWWEPGTKVGYHAYTFGYIVGEIAQRISGRSISQLLRDEVAGPLGVADEIYFGMPVSEHGRLARLEDAPSGQEWDPAALPRDLPMLRAGGFDLLPSAAFGNRTDVLSADIPAGGKVTARAIGRMYAALLGDVDGVRLISPERLREVTAVVASGPDEVFGMPTRFGLGYAVEALWGAPSEHSTVFGMGGAGGSWAGADTASGFSLAITKNMLTNDFDAVARIGALVTKAVAG